MVGAEGVGKRSLFSQILSGSHVNIYDSSNHINFFGDDMINDADASDNVPVDTDAVNVLADAENVVDAVHLPEPGCR